jgi:hypothetical protein
MKLPLDPRLPITNSDKLRPLIQRLYELFREYSKAFNDSYMWDTEGTSAPSSGTWAIGDKCKNTAPSELGSAGSKYVVIGWVYTATGWLAMRTLTGN